MDEFLKPLLNSDISAPDNIDFIFSFFTAMLAATIIAYSYKKTHSGYSFSPNFIVSLILTSGIIALIMIIIGSNIARAFALVGAMSIVRFRNPVKETRDLVYLFASIAAGMAAGTGFFSMSILFAVLFFLTSLLFEFFSTKLSETLIYVISINCNNESRKKFEENLKKFSYKYVFLSMTSYKEDNDIGEFAYEVELKNNKSLKELKESTINLGIPSIKVIFGQSDVGS